MKIGIGQDSHVFEEGKPLFLGGMIFPDHAGLKANSDGDVILHAVCNAVSSAIGGGSISTFADEMVKEGVEDSKEFVSHVENQVRKKGMKINNVSVTVEASRPKMENHLPQMRKTIAELFSIEIGSVGITVTSGEGMTSAGKGEGISVIALVTIDDN